MKKKIGTILFLIAGIFFSAVVIEAIIAASMGLDAVPVQDLFTSLGLSVALALIQCIYIFPGKMPYWLQTILHFTLLIAALSAAGIIGGWFGGWAAYLQWLIIPVISYAAMWIGITIGMRRKGKKMTERLKSMQGKTE